MSGTGLFTPPLRGGTWVLQGSVTELEHRLQGAGWRTAVLRGTDKATFLTEIARGLEFPQWFGHNLDALWDCLGDLTAPTAILWCGWAEMSRTHHRDWRTLREVLLERTHDQQIPFALVWHEG